MGNLPENQQGSRTTSRIIRVRDLPIHYDRKNDDIQRYIPRIEDERPKIIDNSHVNNNWLFSTLSQSRQSVQQIWNDNKNLRSRIVRGVETGGAHAKATMNYIRDDETFVPKVGVATVAGLGGLLLGHRGSIVRKTLYSSVAAAVALSVCYPKQTTNLLDQIYIRIKNQSKHLIDKSDSNRSSTLVNLNGKDRIIHVAKSEQQSTDLVQGDYGQSTPADQHLYTTRKMSNVKPSTSENEM